jgi:cytochrome c oxidase subunit 4
MSPQAVSVRTYLAVFAGLLTLTLATVWVASIPLGHWHTFMALAIAAVKGTLIFLFFMHGLQSGRLIWLIALGALLGLAIMLSLTMADYQTRRLDEKIRQVVPSNRLSSPSNRWSSL